MIIDYETIPRRPNATYYGPLKVRDIRNKLVPIYGFEGRAWEQDGKTLFLPVGSPKDDDHTLIVHKVEYKVYE